MKKFKKENLGLLLGPKYVPVNIKWNHKTTLCVSNFVPSEIMPLSSWFVTGHERLMTSRLTVSGNFIQSFFPSTQLQPAKAAALTPLKT